jgi:PAS domain S-box-containing protein
MKKLLRVLFIEDSLEDAELLIIEFKRAGYEIVFRRVETAKEMLNAIKEEEWDLIVSDYYLPEFKGLQALALYKDIGIDIPFIMVTGIANEESAVESLKAGAHDFVNKRNLSRFIPAVNREIKEAKIRREFRKAVNEISESHRRYKALYDSTRDAIMTLNPETGFTAGNPACIRMFACKNEAEFISYGPDTLSPEYQPDGSLSSVKAGQMILEAVNTGSNFFEWTHKRTNGEEFFASVLLTKVIVKGVAHLQATVRDITESKLSREAIEKAHANANEMLEKAMFGVVIISMEKKILWVNEIARQMAEADSIDNMIGKSCTEYLCPAKEGKCPILDQEKSVDNSEKSLVRKDGSKIQIIKTVNKITYNGKPALLETFVDITESKKARKQNEPYLKVRTG